MLSWLSCNPATHNWDLKSLSTLRFRVVAEAIEVWSWFHLYVLQIWSVFVAKRQLWSFASQFTRFDQQGSHANCPQKTLVKGWKDETNARSGWNAQDSTVNELEPLSSSHCLHDDSRRKPAFRSRQTIGAIVELSIRPRFACRYYRRIRSHLLLQQGSFSTVSCTCSLEIIFLQRRLLLPESTDMIQHVDVGLTPIGDKLCVKVVD